MTISERGDNFRLVKGQEAEVSLAAWRSNDEMRARLNPPIATAFDLKTGPWAPEEDATIRALWPGHSDAQIANILDRPYESVGNRRRRVLGLVAPMRPPRPAPEKIVKNNDAEHVRRVREAGIFRSRVLD